MSRPERIGIMVGPRGRGSNMAAIVRAGLPVGIVIAPEADAPALAVARDLGAPAAVIEYGDDYADRLLAALADCTLLCLAGYMRLLPAEVLARFPRRVLNIHPSLLPAYGGKGMYGIRVHRAVIEAGEHESGCTVHYVTPHYDEGDIAIQLRCPVLTDDTPETLAVRVQALEHQAYVQAIRNLIASNTSGE